MTKLKTTKETPYHSTRNSMFEGRTLKMKLDHFIEDPQGTGIVFPSQIPESEKERLREIKRWLDEDD